MVRGRWGTPGGTHPSNQKSKRVNGGCWSRRPVTHSGPGGEVSRCTVRWRQPTVCTCGRGAAHADGPPWCRRCPGVLAGLWQSLNRFILVGSCLIPRHHPTTMPFGRVVSLGDRVRAVATTVRGDAWAKHHFPRDWKSHEVMGVVTGKEGRSVLVRWDDDGDVCKTGTRNVFVVAQPGGPADAEPAGAPAETEPAGAHPAGAQRADGRGRGRGRGGRGRLILQT